MPRLLVAVAALALLASACSTGGGSDDPAPAPTTAPQTPSATSQPPATAEPTATATPPPAPPTVAATPTIIPSGLPGPLTLVDILVDGGYVIYFRHAATDRSQPDSNRDELADCATQRNLNDEGRAQSRAIGIAFQRLGIPVGRVLSSQYCRARETAELAFGRAETTADISSPVGIDEVEDRRRIDALRALLGTPPEAGTNTILVAHQFNLRDAADVSLGVEGEAAVFAPDGRGAYTLLERVLPEGWTALANAASGPQLQEYAVPAGAHPHDVAPAPDGAVWYTAQRTGELGRLDPVTGATTHVPLGDGSAPHGVIVGPDGAPWVTDGGLSAIVRVDPGSQEVRVFPLPDDRPGANLNTAAFDRSGVLWFTGQNGVYGRLDPASGAMEVFDAPGGRGPYGITTTPDGAVYYASLAGSHIARIDPTTGAATVVEPPTPGQGARRVWADSLGRVWVSEWTAGQVGVYDRASGDWREWPLPGEAPQAYAVYVDDRDVVWLSDFPNNALVRFDPISETFESYPLPSTPANVRQILGRPGEVWGAESGVDKIVVLRHP